jgi:hypothetical protein
MVEELNMAELQARVSASRSSQPHPESNISWSKEMRASAWHTESVEMPSRTYESRCLSPQGTMSHVVINGRAERYRERSYK